MGMSAWYGPTDEAESIAAIHRALELGIDFLDTADVYGQGANEQLVGKAIAGRREEFVIATKFGNRWFDDGRRTIDGSPEYVHAAIDRSLQRLGVDYVDLYYQHRVDANTPIEDTVGAMAELVTAGEGRHRGPAGCPPACRKPARTRSGARMPCTRSPPCSRSGRSGRATPRARCSRPSASSASASSPIARSAAVSSQGGSRRPRS